MNYIKHLTGFFEKVTQDKLLNPTHVSMYIALFQFWNINRFRNPISISRHEIMRISKISSLATYHRCLKLLDAHGYIKYEPSFNPYKGSHVFLFDFADDLKPIKRNDRSATTNFEDVGKQAVYKLCPSTGTGSEQVDEQALVPYINSTNNTNNTNISKDSNSLNLVEQARKIEVEILNFKNDKSKKEEKSSAKKEEKVNSPTLANDSNNIEQIHLNVSLDSEEGTGPIPQKSLPNPTIEVVIDYFRTQNFPDIEANKFFNYFKSIGWLVGGRIPMTDWPAAARNWMLNAPKFKSNERTDTTKSFDTSADKDYSEPL